MLQLNQIDDTLKKEGSIKIEKILNQKELDRIKEIILGINESFHNKETIFACNIKSLIIKFLKFDVKKFSQSIELINLSKNKKFDKISKNFFGKKEKINMIDGYVSKKSNVNIIDWHCDQPYYEEKLYSNQELTIEYHLTISFFLSASCPSAT